MPTILDTHFDDLEYELASTRRVLERFPAEHADWRPHDKSMTLAQLAAHVAWLPRFAERMLTSEELDFATNPPTTPAIRTADELVALHDDSAASARKHVAATTSEFLDTQWTLRAGDQVLLRDRRGKLLRQHLVSHIAHHRGQLTVYYRILGVPLPGIYGPTADER